MMTLNPAGFPFSLAEPEVTIISTPWRPLGFPFARCAAGGNDRYLKALDVATAAKQPGVACRNSEDAAIFDTRICVKYLTKPSDEAKRRNRGDIAGAGAARSKASRRDSWRR